MIKKFRHDRRKPLPCLKSVGYNFVAKQKPTARKGVSPAHDALLKIYSERCEGDDDQITAVSHSALRVAFR